ncbi:MAG: flagellar biosynthesis protein FlhA, partial [Pseudomonadota bacterium]
GFAFGVLFILSILFLPLPGFLVDLGLAVSFALSILILMVALWIKRPLDFSAFPTVLLIATMLRLALNIATTRLILTDGSSGQEAAGYVISGFSTFVMAGDFVIGLVVFLILLTVNFLVITKGAGRIAEVGARFALDAVPGKQMAIDADLSSGLIGEKEAQRRRRELEEESAFFGSMDGASKFVRGDAIAGLIITAVNIFGGIAIAVIRHDMAAADAVDVFTKLSVGDGLVTQIPALIISLAAGLVVAKGGAREAADAAVLGQLSSQPRALLLTAGMLGIFALIPGLPFFPFAVLAGLLAFAGILIPRRWAAVAAAEEARVRAEEESKKESEGQPIKQSLQLSAVEIVLGTQLAATFLSKHGELEQRVTKMRRKFARQYGFIIPEIGLSDDPSLPANGYQIRVHGTTVSNHLLPVGDVLLIIGNGPKPSFPGEETTEPAFGMKAMWVPEAFSKEAKVEGFTPVDPMTVLLTHLSEVIRSSLSQLLSYRDMQHLLQGLPPEYQKLLDEIVPANISLSGIQAVLKMLLAERVSIRNLSLILEAVAEIAPHVRRAEHVVEHVRQRLAPQICGDIAVDDKLSILRLGNRWELAFHEALRRNQSGEVVEFDMDPRLLEDFVKDVTAAVEEHQGKTARIALVTAADARPCVRMLVERFMPTLSVLSHIEIARVSKIESLGNLS